MVNNAIERPQAAPLSRQPTLGDVVKHYRIQHGWTQSELVLKLDGALDQGQLSRLEGGTLKTPRLHVLRKLGDVLGVPPGRLLKLSRFPGAPILSDSLEAALVELPQEQFPVVEVLVRLAADALPPNALSDVERAQVADFLRDVQQRIGL